MILKKAGWQWFWYGYLSGLVCGLGDILWSIGALEQFLPTVAGRVLAALFLMGLYGTAGSLVALGLSFLCRGFYESTQFGENVRAFGVRHDQLRDRHPARAFSFIAHLVAWTLLGLGALWVAYRIGLATILTRNHKGLVVIVVIAVTLFSLLLAGALGFFLARLLAYLLRRFLPRSSHNFFSRISVAIGCALGIVLASGIALLADNWELVSQLRPRPAFVTLAFGVVLGLLKLFGARVSPRFPAVPYRVSRLLPWAVLLASLALILSLGNMSGVRKGSTAHTGLGGILSEGLKRLGDLDGDGFSSLLGGGDCLPFDGNSYPGAVDIPGDGLDQDCSGDDVAVYRREGDAGFVRLPGEIKGDENILFISIDALRADHVSAYGYRRKTTPNVDAIAAKGVVFENAWAHAPSTRYSIPAILTGRHPSQVLWNMSMWWPGLKSGNDTIAELLQRQGFTTGALLSYHYFHPKRLINQGFDFYDNSLARLHRGRNPASTAGSSAAELADRAIRFIGQHARKRFFLWVHFYDPHYQYEKHEGTPEFGTQPVDLYDHEILFTDAQIGRVLNALNDAGLQEKTIIVLTADHGTGFGEHGIKHHGYHLYGAQTRVPLILYVPGLEARRIQSPAGHVDLLPTLANLTGAQQTPLMFGRSLVGPMTGAIPRERVVFQEVIYEGPTERWAAISDKWHLIYNRIPDNTFELYDLEKDRGEKHDLWGKVEVDRLKERLLSWIDVGRFPPETYARLASAVRKTKPRPQVTIQAEFDGKVVLEGVDLGGARVSPGGEIELTAYFKALQKMPRGYRVFVHIRGPKRFFSGDHEPVDGALPFESWIPGQWIVDRQLIDIPRDTPPGAYELTMGIYRGRKRLEVDATTDRKVGRNAIRVGTVEIVR